MTRADAAKLVGIIVMAYPNYDKFKDENAVKATVDLWAMMFKDDPAGVVGLATKKHIATNKWPPSIAEIRELMLELTAPDLIPPDQAWLAVADYIDTQGEYGGGDHTGCLPPLIARVIDSIGYHNLYDLNCGSFRGNKPGMARVAFNNIYTPLYEREKKRAMTPKEVTEKIDNAARSISDGSIKMLESVHKRKLDKDAEYMTLMTRSLERAAIGDGKGSDSDRLIAEGE